MTQKKEIRLLVPESVHKLFKIQSQSDGVSISHNVRKLIYKHLTDNGHKIRAIKIIKKNGVVTIHMTSKQKTQLYEYSEKMGHSMSACANTLITNAISKEPYWLHDEIRAMENNSRELNLIGHNLNQLIKLIHQGSSNTIDHKIISDLAKRCSEQKKVVNTLLKAAKDR